MNLSASPGRPACPSRASGWSSLTTPWGLPCCVRFPCVHAVAPTRAQRLGVSFAHSPQPYQPSPKGLSGRPAHRPFRGLLGVYSRYGLHTRAVTVYRDTLSEGFSHFVTSMTAPVASGWSGCRVGLAPTGKRLLCTAHTRNGPSSPLPQRTKSQTCGPFRGHSFHGLCSRARARPCSSKFSSESHARMAARRVGHSSARIECHA